MTGITPLDGKLVPRLRRELRIRRYSPLNSGALCRRVDFPAGEDHSLLPLHAPTARSRRILDSWIELAIAWPIAEHVQTDGRIRRWVHIPEEQRYLRVVLLEDCETVHNAFFDRTFQP